MNPEDLWKQFVDACERNDIYAALDSLEKLIRQNGRMPVEMPSSNAVANLLNWLR